ncbi:hypothetical protein Q3V23_25365 [Streptomyces sp. VNUA116]|uniref:hypothetical protein n=1 Tax=Streptomyces sp. VNUA116 TaxID=3062449 RepID=UPI0026745671|nr:hypothetical protein [Streptomyces sp. VNUA116]WKU47119.1 hypothetical protein Q3V23_25365 [Streptomyces sp. VNUA116]
MLTEALEGLAAAGGSAVVGAAATDAWNTARAGVARLLGRGDSGRERYAIERLDRTAGEIEQAPDEDRQQLRDKLRGRWTGRLEILLEEHPEAADELRELIDRLRAELPAARESWVQNNTAEAGGIQYITQGGDIHVDRGGRSGD